MKRIIITMVAIFSLFSVVSGGFTCPPGGSNVCPTSGLSDPNHGTVITNDPMCLLKAIAKYTCDDGFVPEGDTIRCCVQDDIFSIPMWSGSEPTCVEECPADLDDPEHGCVVTTGNKPGDKAVYFCDYGFTLKREKKRKCVDGKWSGTDPTCEKKCPKLPNIHYGKVYADGLKPGSTSTYHCKYGYHLNGYKKRVCDEDGTWTYEEPTCDKNHEEKYTPWTKSYSSGSSKSSSYSSSSSKRSSYK